MLALSYKQSADYPRRGLCCSPSRHICTPLRTSRRKDWDRVADAIEGLKTGNAPGMWMYKGAPQWAEPICKYLRA